MLAEAGEFGNDYISYNSYPLLINVPQILLHKQNTLEIFIYSPRGMIADVSEVIIGDIYLAKKLFDSAKLNLHIQLIIIILCVFISIFTLLFYFIDCHSLFIYYSIAEFCYAIFILGGIIVEAPMPWSWWYCLYMSSHFLALLSVSMVFINLLDDHQVFKHYYKYFCLFSFICFFIIIVIFNVFDLINLYTYYYQFMYAIFALLGFYCAFHVYKAKNYFSVFLSLIITIYSISLVHDTFSYYFTKYISYRIFFEHWDKYVWPLFSILMTIILFNRIYKVYYELKMANFHTNELLNCQKQELNFLYQQQKEQEKKSGSINRKRKACSRYSRWHCESTSRHFASVTKW